MGACPEHIPTGDTKHTVFMAVTMGIPQEDIARLLDISKKTLYKYYRRELDNGALVANIEVKKKMYEKCMNGDSAMLIFWGKTKMGMKESSSIDLKVGKLDDILQEIDGTTAGLPTD